MALTWDFLGELWGRHVIPRGFAMPQFGLAQAIDVPQGYAGRKSPQESITLSKKYPAFPEKRCWVPLPPGTLHLSYQKKVDQRPTAARTFFMSLRASARAISPFLRRISSTYPGSASSSALRLRMGSKKLHIFSKRAFLA